MTLGKQMRMAAQPGIASMHTATTSRSTAIGSGSNSANWMAQTGATITGAGHPNLSSTLTTINLSNLNSIGISGLSVLDTLGTHHAVKKYEIYESPEDLLALSVALHRHNNTVKDPSAKYHRLLTTGLFDKVQDSDKTTAQEIRDYYSKKIMMWKLKDSNNMSKYREDLNTFVHSDGLKFKEEMIGLAYHLPLFREYDLQLDYIRSCVDVNQQFKKLDSENKPRTMRLTVEMEPIKKLLKKRKRVEVLQYWFKDVDLNAACLITLDIKNPLEHIWDNIFDNEKTLKIEGTFIRRNTDDFEYFRITDWKLTKI
jgi:hypothetical protein